MLNGLKWAAAALVVLCAACVSTQTAPTASVEATATTPSTPSPRPECAQAHVTIYFTEEVASDQPVVAPLLNDLMNSVHACEAAGGELRGVTVAATTDQGLNATEAQAQLRRRQERVAHALVGLGVPADKIHSTRAEGDAVMGRRADLTADLY